MAAQGEAPLPMRLTPQVAGWSMGFRFILAKILSPKARRAAAHGSTCRRQGEIRERALGHLNHRLVAEIIAGARVMLASIRCSSVIHPEGDRSFIVSGPQAQS